MLGGGVTEFEPMGKAAGEIRALWAWMERKMEKLLQRKQTSLSDVLGLRLEDSDDYDIREWHTYAVKWEPGRVQWYADGNLIKNYTDAEGFNGAQLYIIIDGRKYRKLE